jgi:hypothetical protein
MIYGLFIVNESFCIEKGLKYNIALIFLMRETIPDICINIDKKYL